MRWPLLIVMALFMAASGCKKPKPQEEEAKPAAPPPIRKGGLARTIDRTRLANQLKQIGLAYMTFSTEGRAPSKLEEFMPYLENDQAIGQLLREGHVVVFWGARLNNLPQGSSQTILAYEKEPDDQGLRYVLFADTAVTRLGDKEFQAAPKAGQGR